MRPSPLRTAARVGAILAVAAPLAVLGVRAYVRLTNRPFYHAVTRRIALPGLSEGFIPQDLFYCEVVHRIPAEAVGPVAAAAVPSKRHVYA